MKKFFFFAFIFIITISLLPKISFANTLNVYIKEPTRIIVGEPAMFKIYVDTGDNEINVLEGSLEIGGSLDIVGVSIEKSIFSMWPNEPSISGQKISFTGGTPGGVFGKDLRVFDLSIIPRSAGTISFSSQNMAAYLNDSFGTEVLSAPVNYKILVKEKEEIKNNWFFFGIIIILVIFYFYRILKKRKNEE
ncbi:MAG: hypothetical protein WC609_03050 [Candidatus Paceibacterota bacterium]|jgi:hypothetical protein